MVRVENFSNAYKEVYVILNNMNAEAVEAIPESFINMIKNNMNNNYQFEINNVENIENQKLLKETKVILAYIFLNYWGTEEQNARINQKFRQDIIKEEKSKPLYAKNELFKDEKNYIEKKSEEMQLVEVKKENVFIKLVNFIKNMIRRK